MQHAGLPVRRVHFTGVGGIGMSAVAMICAEMGVAVSGSDMQESANTRALRRIGCQLFIGHAADNAANADLVVYSSAVRPDNPELAAARQLGVPVLHRSEMLELVSASCGGIRVAVSGMHGKTSTAAMIASAMIDEGWSPTFLIGGRMVRNGRNAMLGEGEVAVYEADESDGSFANLRPSIMVITNLDVEHLDHYGSFAAIRDRFRDYVDAMCARTTFIVCGDDPELTAATGGAASRVTFGLSEGCSYRASGIRQTPRGVSFRLSVREGSPIDIFCPFPGRHVVLNAMATIAACEAAGMDLRSAARGVEGYTGVMRRLELKGEAGGVRVYDDYAHHPAEVAATLGAFRVMHAGGLYVVFQPHRHSRTRDLLDSFGECFAGSSRVLVLDIYAAGEQPVPGVDAVEVARRIGSHGTPAEHLPSFEAAGERLLQLLNPGDAVVTMGAGDVYRLGEMLVENLRQRDGVSG